jgi:hypothetical protein
VWEREGEKEREREYIIYTGINMYRDSPHPNVSESSGYKNSMIYVYIMCQTLFHSTLSKRDYTVVSYQRQRYHSTGETQEARIYEAIWQKNFI